MHWSWGLARGGGGGIVALRQKRWKCHINILVDNALQVSRYVFLCGGGRVE